VFLFCYFAYSYFPVDVFEAETSIFKGTNHPTPSETLVTIGHELDITLQKMKFTMSRASAREFFSEMKIQLEGLLLHSVNFLAHSLADKVCCMLRFLFIY
jgi:hypothetical protein